MSRKLLILVTLLAAACSPAANPSVFLPQQTPPASNPGAEAPAFTPPEQPIPEPAKQTKGQKTSQALTPTGTPLNTALFSIPVSSDPAFTALAISGQPTDTSIMINLIPAVDMQFAITYATENGVKQTITAVGKANVPQEIQLSNLQPSTEYYYQVNDGEKHTFHTARVPGSTFIFDVQGDSHPERTKTQFDPALYVRTLTGAAGDEPDFYITIGDDFSVDALKIVNRQTVMAQYINQRQWLGLVDAPVFLVNGNHEQASLANLDGTAENVAVWAQTARNAIFPQPAPDAFYSGNMEPVEHIGLLRNYYAWEWGDALFVVIDPYWHSPQTVDNMFGASRDEKKNRNLWNVTLGETQYRWFRQTLETSPAKFKFVFAHHVNGTGRGGIELADSFEWGDSANLATYRPGWDKTIHQIMVESGVTIFFQGHDHIFASQELDGVTYQSLPEPANPFFSLENADAYKTGDLFPNSGRIRVTVSPEEVKVEYIRSYLDKPDQTAITYTLP